MVDDDEGPVFAAPVDETPSRHERPIGCLGMIEILAI